jgi:hypothetical protein
MSGRGSHDLTVAGQEQARQGLLKLGADLKQFQRV